MNTHFVFPEIDPVMFSIGPVSLHWYGFMYLVGFAGAYLMAKRRVDNVGITHEQLSDLMFYGFLGVILGGRIGYVLFYQFDYFLDNPVYLLKMWEGGMSFHGGLLGVIAALFLYGKKVKMNLFQVGDFVAPIVPIGLGAGRIGNFINAELWGRTTDVSWGVVFPNAGELPRHPSQLYEFALEGVVLFTILWLYSAKPRPTGAVGGLFLLGYGAFRYFVEFFREPDSHLQDIYGGLLTQGQMLCIPMMAIGLWLIIRAYRAGQNTPVEKA